MEQNVQEELLSTQQVASELGISRVAVLKKINTGAIKAHKVGRNYVIRRSDLIGKMSAADKDAIDNAVKKAVREYGEVFKLLGKE